MHQESGETGKASAVGVIDSIPKDYIYRSVTERYFTRYYCLGVGEKNNDHLILFHSNRICVLCLAPTHPILKESNIVVNFKVGEADRTKNKVKGKGKKGGQILETNSQICTVSSGSVTYPIYSCLQGRLIEVNERLLDKSHLLKTLPDSEGYIAIILQKISTAESIKDQLVSHDDYLTLST